MACPLLFQIAAELRQTFPDIFKHHPLNQAWVYKYDSQLSGINPHADFAAVNVNFWITPDAALEDETAGGLVVWDKEAPLDWDFEKLCSFWFFRSDFCCVHIELYRSTDV